MNPFAAVARQLEGIASELEKVGDFDEVKVRQDGASVRVATQMVPFLFIKQAVVYWSGVFGYPIPKVHEDTQTVAYFKSVFGQKRFERISKQIHFEGVFCRKQVLQLFINAGEVLLGDMQELFEEIKGTKSTIRFLSESASQALRLELRAVQTLDGCSNVQLDLLMNMLVPFQQREHLFLKCPPSTLETSFHAPKDFASAKKRVYTYEGMRRGVMTESEYFMHLAKSLADREMPIGVVFKNAQGGYSQVHQVVHGGGAYKYFLKSMGQAAKLTGHTILYRGTNPHPEAVGAWQTLIDDFRLKLGSEGAAATRAETAKLLSDKALGFVVDGNEKITAVAMSLGGAHAQRDFVDLKIHRLVTVESPGIDKKMCDAFAQKVNSGNYKFEREIVHYIEAEDVIDQFGEAHLGAGCKKDKIKASCVLVEPQTENQPLNQPLGQPVSLNDEITRIGKLRKIFAKDVWHDLLPKQVTEFLEQNGIPNWLTSLPNAGYELLSRIFTVHIRNTLLAPAKMIEISNQVHDALSQQILSHQSQLCDPRWEQLRKVLPLTVRRAKL